VASCLHPHSREHAKEINVDSTTAANAPLIGELEFGVQLVRWFETQPGWTRLGPKRREVAAHLALNESSDTLGTLTHRPVWAMSADSRYSVDQIRDTLKALRKHGLAYSQQCFVQSEQGWGRRQAASHYFPAIGKTHDVSRRRQEAAQRGLARRGERRLVGRIPYTAADDEAIRRQVRNHELHTCAHCDAAFLAKKRWQVYCSDVCRKAAHRNRGWSNLAAGETPSGAR
jgi:hypothetical protein